MSDRELERKFVLHNLNNLPKNVLGERQEYVQTYIPNPVGLVMRARQEGGEKILQLKLRNPSDDAPFESGKLNLTDSPEIFARLLEWARSDPGKIVEIRKERSVVGSPSNDGTKELVVDLFHGSGSLEGRIMAEAEFSTLEQMNRWQPPDWLFAVGYLEVTGDHRFNNEWIAEHGWPEDERHD
jgi:CYTH domain-containing protein